MSKSSNSHSIWDINITTDEGLQELEQFLEQDNDPDEVKYVNYGFGKTTYLIEASAQGNIKAIKLLTRFGANVNYDSKSMGTPLSRASARGDIDVCQLLISLGADANLLFTGILFPGTFNISYVSGSAILTAALNGRSQVIKFLIQHGAKPNIIVDPILGRYTPLASAASKGHLEAVKALIDGGADINFMHPIGFAPIHEAVINGHLEIVRFLVENGADINKHGSLFGATPLYFAQGVGRRKPSETNREIQHYLAQNGGISHISWWYHVLVMAGWEFYFY